MSSLALIRHAQASLFESDYDKLSERGERQARKLDELVTATYSIDEAPRAFEDLEKGVNARGVIVF